METTITINAIQEKVSTAGKPYYLITTDKGIISCWDAVMANVLKASMGKVVNAEIAEKGQFKNIKKILPEFQTQRVGTEQNAQVVQKYVDNFAAARAVKNQSYFISYAKDVFCALVAIKLPTESYSDVVKQSVGIVQEIAKNFQ